MNEQVESEEMVGQQELLSPREQDVLGQTPPEGEWVPNIPIAVQRGMSAREAASLREKRFKDYHSVELAFALGFEKPLAVQVGDIDMQTGEVIDELKFVGFWIEETKSVEYAKNEDEFDAEIKRKLKEIAERK